MAHRSTPTVPPTPTTPIDLLAIRFAGQAGSGGSTAETALPGGCSETPSTGKESATASARSARSFGQPGGWWRARYLRLRTAAADSAVVPDEAEVILGGPAVDPQLRQSLIAALAEEEAARMLGTLDPRYTIWHDVSTGVSLSHPDRKLDHVVLGPSGLYAVISSDWGAALRLKKRELVGAGLARGEKPIRALYRRARHFARTSGVQFSALMMVVPDDAVTAPLTVVRRRRGCPTLLIRRSWLPEVVTSTMGGMAITAAEDLAIAREQLAGQIRFITASGAESAVPRRRRRRT